MGDLRFRPLHDRVVVRRVKEEEKTRGGLYIPDNAQEKPSEGEIVAVGPGNLSDSGTVQPLSVKYGDRIIFGKWSGNEITIEGQEYIVMKESDIIGILS